MSVKLAYQPLVFCSFSLTATPKQIGEIHKNDDHGISNQVGHRMTLIKNNLVNYKIVTSVEEIVKATVVNFATNCKAPTAAPLLILFYSIWDNYLAWKIVL